jgi:hypothetical protein
MVEAGIPEKHVMEIIGHSSRALLDRYHIVNSEDVMASVERAKL